MDSRIIVEKVREGLWNPRTFYWSYVNGESVGKYVSKSEAIQAAEARIANTEAAWKALAEEFE